MSYSRLAILAVACTVACSSGDEGGGERPTSDATADSTVDSGDAVNDSPVEAPAETTIDASDAPAAVYGDITDISRWSVFDVSTLNANAVGFTGGAFDGRYVYFGPGSRSLAVRYDTTATFASTGAWETFDLAPASGVGGFPGFDGKRVYFVLGGFVERYDVASPFGTATSWQKVDTSPFTPLPTSFWGSVFDGKHLYLNPGAVSGNRIVLRYDTTSPFAWSSGPPWSSVDLKKLDSTVQQPFQCAAFDGRYVYIANSSGSSDKKNYVARYDTLSPSGLDSPASWTLFDTMTLSPKAYGFLGAVFDGRYLYLLGFGQVAARYDTTAAFASSASWSTFDVKALSTDLYVGGGFDGRFVYFAPGGLGGSNSVVLRHDTSSAAGFSDGKSWTAFDLKSVSLGAKSYAGAVFDGRYLYLVPNVGSSPPHGVVARFDARTPRAIPKVPGWFTWGPGSFE